MAQNMTAVLARVAGLIPDCLAVALVHRGLGEPLAHHTLNPWPAEVIQMAAAQAVAMIDGSARPMINGFRAARGQPNLGEGERPDFFTFIVAESATLVHVFATCPRKPDLLVAFVTRPTNLGMLKLKCREAVTQIEAAYQ
jgi:hypothetical protein